MFSTEELTNQVFGYLFVLGRADKQKYKKRYWLCRCICGKELAVETSRLKNGVCKSCGCSRIKVDVAERELFRRYRDGAIKRTLAFTLSLDIFKQAIHQDCYYCGIKPERRYESRRGAIVYYNGLDRVDNAQGYTTDNIVSCCRTCNFAKHTSDQTDFIARSKAVAARHTPTWQENVRTTCNCISIVVQIIGIFLLLHFRPR